VVSIIGFYNFTPKIYSMKMHNIYPALLKY